MRADRLLAMILLLQTHGRMTARQLAAELEVSERTIYRDVTALSTAGVPLYTEGGSGGGIALVESYRTDLTGLNLDEVQALSMLGIPEPLVRLGVGQQLKAALLKLSAAVPAAGRERQVQARQRIHLDASWWFQPEEATPHLQTLQQAVWQDRMLRVTFRGDFATVHAQEIAPYGLVAKASSWYLVYDLKGHFRARRVARVLAASMLPQGFERRQDFDLAAFWQQWCADFERERPRYEVQLLVAPELGPHLANILGGTEAGTLNAPPTLQAQAGWQAVTLDFDSFEAARTRILGLGGAVEVIAPLALRLSVADFARQIQARYGARPGERPD